MAIRSVPGMPDVPDKTGKWKFTDGMDEISGFGGGYEQTCRNMLAAVLDWFDANPNADPKFHGFEGVFGLIVEDNDDAKAMTKAALGGADGDCTGAMMQAVTSHAFFVKQKGWAAYVAEMEKRDEEVAK